jgi:hypothetical protein
VIDPKALARALATRERLNAACDDLNIRITAAEKAIVDLKLGVAADVLLESRPNGFSRHLSFLQDGGRWRLAITEGEEFTPLVNTSRAIRIQAVEHLHRLVEAIATAVEIEESRVDSARTHVSRFVEELR